MQISISTLEGTILQNILTKRCLFQGLETNFVFKMSNEK